jgi:hypothetical protein
MPWVDPPLLLAKYSQVLYHRPPGVDEPRIGRLTGQLLNLHSHSCISVQPYLARSIMVLPKVGPFLSAVHTILSPSQKMPIQ